MNKKECPSCALAVDAKDTVCPYCGFEFPAENVKMKWLAWVLIIMFIMYFIFTLLRR